MTHIFELAKKEQDYVVKTRRYFHKKPELSLQEKETSAFVCAELDKLSIPYEIVGEYGVLARIEGKNTKKMVMLRADMDALPIHEENTHVDYCSQNDGVMHACGHDAHTAMLLGAARVLHQIKDQLNGSVLLCFQQSEEFGYGALPQVEAMKKYPVNSCFAIHVSSKVETGYIQMSSGAVNASSDTFYVKIQGQGGHGSRPDLTKDPLLAAAHMICELNRAKASEISPFNPLTISVGHLETPGGRFNIIPNTTSFEGTIRATDQKVREQAIALLQRIGAGIAQTNNVSVDITIDYETSTYAIVNDEQCVGLAKKSFSQFISEDHILPQPLSLGAEDFSEFTNLYPGIFTYLGTKNDALETGFDHHHPRFNIDESPLYLGVAMHAQYAFDKLNEE